jgi:hypothetical protein
MKRAAVCLSIAVCVLTLLVVSGLSIPAASAGAASVRATAESARSRVALNPQPEPPIFRVMSVAELRSLKASHLASQVVAPPQPIPDPAPINRLVGMLKIGSQPTPPPTYAGGNGVVLDAVHPYDNPSNSSLLVLGVMYNSELRYHIQYDHPDTVLYQEIPLTNSWNGVSATFRKLPSGEHTYVLTLGHTADPNRVSITINGQQFGPDKLIANPATSEIRALFTCDASASGGNIPVFVRFSFADAQVSAFEEFHHLQLAQLD